LKNWRERGAAPPHTASVRMRVNPSIAERVSKGYVAATGSEAVPPATRSHAMMVGRRRKRPRVPTLAAGEHTVTLIVGIKAQDVFALCSDSQETLGDGNKTERNKLPVSRAVGQFDVVIGTAGCAPLSDALRARLVRSIGRIRAKSAVGIEAALGKALEAFHGSPVFTEFNAAPEGKNLAGFIGVWCRKDGTPHLFKYFNTTIEAVTGCDLVGDNYGMHALMAQRGYKPQMPITSAVVHIVNVLALAKETSQFVGGPLRMVGIGPLGIHEHSPERLADAERRAREMHAATFAVSWELADPSISEGEFNKRVRAFATSATAARAFYGRDAWSSLDMPLTLKDDDDF
jgi:hypothetical protein